MKDIQKYPISRRAMLGAIGMTAGSAAMYDAMLHMGYAATSDFKGPITLSGDAKGQTVLVLGASSGVGIAAIQIAKLFHCRVITTAGDDAKLAKGRELGADYGINHYQQKISEEVRKITNKEGVDIVVEHVGAATWDESVRSLKSSGTLVTCGATTGPNVGIDLRHLFGRQLTLLGSYMGTMAELHEVLQHVFAGRLKPVVDRVFPLSEIRAAHEYLEKSQMFGKIVVNP